jgi:hypothetical protein
VYTYQHPCAGASTDIYGTLWFCEWGKESFAGSMLYSMVLDI